MEKHDCIHEKDFQKLEDIETKLNTLILNVAAQTTVVANLILSQAVNNGIKEYKQVHAEMTWKKTAVISSIIISIGAITITLILHFT